MQIAVIACSNGLGHIKRDIKIINDLRALDILKVDLYCERWQIEKLQEWKDFQIFRKSKDRRIFYQDFPLKWSNDSGYYGEWLSSWHDRMKDWDLDHYDVIFSDNYIEPLIYARNVLLGGSFLWHDILLSFSESNKEIRDYWNWATCLMKERAPSMVVNKYFVMESVLHQVDPRRVGIIHFSPVPRRPRVRNSGGRKKILIALGNAELDESHLHKLQEFIRASKNSEYCIYCSDAFKERFAPDGNHVKPYPFHKQNLNGMDIAIIRGGLGTISDCIAARIPMIFIHDINPEVQHNQECLVKMGIGIPISSINDPERSPLLNTERYQSMVNHFSHFDLNGIKEASDIIKSKMMDRSWHE